MPRKGVEDEKNENQQRGHQGCKEALLVLEHISTAARGGPMPDLAGEKQEKERAAERSLALLRVGTRDWSAAEKLIMGQ